MPAYKDEIKETWYCKFYYTDWTGEKKQKLKRGFKRQRDAKDWERKFLEQQQGNPDMTFGALHELYYDDMSKWLRLSTLKNKESITTTKILPYFKNMPINQIKPAQIRKWQGELISKEYSETYLKTINNQITAILNYAVKYYGLKENPCHKAGSMGASKASEMLFWTRSEFETFIEYVNRPIFHAALMVLYWSGARMGELTALTPNDIDFGNNSITINKSYRKIDGKDVITKPKTLKSTRTILLPDFVMSEIKQFMDSSYDLKKSDRVFTITKNPLRNAMDKAIAISGVKRIRIHDLRHSHASLLIELGASPLLIAWGTRM